MTWLNRMVMHVAVVLTVALPAYAGESYAGSESARFKGLARNSHDSLPGTGALMRDDNLIPTQNRTQAMRIEAETGHLPWREEKMLQNAKHTTGWSTDKSAAFREQKERQHRRNHGKGL